MRHMNKKKNSVELWSTAPNDKNALTFANGICAKNEAENVLSFSTKKI